MFACRHQGSDDSGYLGNQGDDLEARNNALNAPPLPPPVSNNQRWMLYKISKQTPDSMPSPGMCCPKKKKEISPKRQRT